MEPDIWLDPALVFKVIGAEIILRPIHTEGWNVQRRGSGLAIRFPRMTRVRDDKAAAHATTVQEIVQMYRRRLRQAG